MFSWKVESLEGFCFNFLNHEIGKLEMVSRYQKEERDIISLLHLGGTSVNWNNWDSFCGSQNFLYQAVIVVSY